MTIDRMIALLNIERACVETASSNQCERDCGNCVLCQDDRELIEMYYDVVNLLKGLKECENQ